MWKCVLKKFKGTEGKRGFTLMELLTVVGIIAILCGIVMISAVTIKRNMDFKQRNDYAKTIFMAAQTRLSQLRSEGALTDLRSGNDNSGSIPSSSGFPGDASQYRYTYSNLGTGSGVVDSFTAVLPANSVEEQLRVNQIIIEYNPLSGNVFSVFYSEKSQSEENLLGKYLGGELSRDNESQRKSMMLGYYEGSVVLGYEEEPEESAQYSVQAELVYVNEQEAKVTAYIPVPGAVNANNFLNGVSVTMTMVGDDSGKEKTLTPMASPKLDNGKVVVEYLLDSLKDGKSFASVSSGISTLTSITDESKLTVRPGENVTLKLTASYPGSNITVEVKPGVLSGVNPLFQNMTTNPDGSYTVTVANGRHLQNLNLLSPTVASNVSTVSFFDATGTGINWADTVSYYSGVTNSDKIARALPYFVPIQNATLFGTSTSSGNADVAGNGCTLTGFNIDSSKYTTGKYYVSPSQTVSHTNCGVIGFAGTNVDISFLNVSGATIKGDTVGSLVGKKAGGSIRNCSATGTITAAGVSCVGGIVGDSTAALSDCVSQVTITYTGSNTSGKIGGLAGQSTSANIENCQFTGNITASTVGYIGGLAGQMSGGTVSNCEATGAISVTSASYVGGLAGNNTANLSACTSGMSISFTGTTSSTAARVGGLAGKSATGTIQNCKFADGITVTAASAGYVGGLVGENTSAISGCSFGVSVSFAGGNTSARVGGVAGKSATGAIQNCTITGTVTAASAGYVGGIVGENSSKLSSCDSGMSVSFTGSNANAKIGGLAGQSASADIQECQSTGNITASTVGHLGGVAGQMSGGTMSKCNPSGSISVTSASFVGGLAGNNTGTVSECHPGGNISVTTSAKYLGGLIGNNSGNLSCSSFEGVIVFNGNNTDARIGGLAGRSAAGEISECEIEKNFVVTVSNASHVGGLVGENLSDLSGCTSRMSISFTGSNANVRIGGVAGQSGVDGTSDEDRESVYNCTTLGSVTATNAGYVGGFVGENYSDISKCNTNATGVSVTYTSTTNVPANVGGLVGKMSDGSISLCTLTSKISYNPNIKTYAAIGKIGGLVGYMTGGTVEDSSVAGEISFTLTGTTKSKKNYQIGGVVGYVDDKDDSGVSFSDVSSSVIVPVGAKESVDVGTDFTDPAGMGPVGMFVGYVDHGVFTNCESTVSNNSTYQFLGQIQWSSQKELGTSNDFDWYSCAGDNAPSFENTTLGSGQTVSSVAAGKGLTARADGYKYVTGYNATLSECTFKYSNDLYSQEFSNEFFYKGSESGSSGTSQELSGVTGTFEDAGDVLFSQLFKTTTSTEDYPTNYYIKKADGSFSRLYITQKYASSKYTITLTDAEGGAVRIWDETSSQYVTTLTGLKSLGSNVISDHVLYTRSLEEEKFVIMDSTGKYALRLYYSGTTAKSEAYELPLDENGNVDADQLDAYCLWTMNASGHCYNVGAKTLDNKTRYLYLTNSSTSSTNANVINTSSPGSYKDLKLEMIGENLYTVKHWNTGSTYNFLQFDSSGPSFVRSIKASTTPANTTLKIQSVIEGTASTKVAEFAQDNQHTAVTCVGKLVES